MELNYGLLKEKAKKHGEAFYILDLKRFESNYRELLGAFKKYYENSNIAYSYKTNYIPKICKLVDRLGGYAEIVSEMEFELARKIGVEYSKIMLNGPYKNPDTVEEILLGGGTVNLDNIEELEIIKNISDTHPEKMLNLGVRCNFPIGDSVVSRFGFDIDGEDFKKVMDFIKSRDNLSLAGIHCHFASRSKDYWGERADTAIKLYSEYGNEATKHIDLGGGIYGKMKPSLKAQFSSYIPDYSEYAEIAAKKFSEKFANTPNAPTLFIEPGTALSGDVLLFAAPVKSIKRVGNKHIATLLGSMYNINPTLNGKNPPITVYSDGMRQKDYENLDFGGYTCIESDYLYKGYNGKLSVGDYVVFENVGSYSVVLKPPFILPNFAIIDLDDNLNETVKAKETFDNIFNTYTF